MRTAVSRTRQANRGGERPQKSLRRKQGGVLSESCEVMRTAVSRTRQANRGGERPQKSLWRKQGGVLSESCEVMRTAVSRTRQANRGGERPQKSLWRKQGQTGKTVWPFISSYLFYRFLLYQEQTSLLP